MPAEPLNSAALDTLFLEARTQNDWADKPISEDLLRKLYDLLKMGPTSANSSPARFVFCSTPAARVKLASMVSAGNRDKVLKASCTVVIGMDLAFHERLPELFPHTDARAWFAGNDALLRETAFRNSSLQAGWLIMAARSLGLDAGPMSGFDKAAIDAEYWAGTTVETNMICAIGYGTNEKIFARSPRLAFEDACRIA